MTGSEFKEHRKALGLTQEGMSQMLGFNRVTIADWERGRPPVPVPVGRLLRLMVQRGVSAEDLPPYEADAAAVPSAAGDQKK